MKKNFESFLAPRLNEFIAYRQDLGYAIEHLRGNLLLFDKYLNDKQPTAAPLSPSFFLQLRANLKMEPLTVNHLLHIVRHFFQFLVRKGLYITNPLEGIPLLREYRFIPFIFSEKQTDQMLSAVCKNIRKDPQYYLKDLCVYVGIVLLARCGMRISEPLRLRRHHYRKDEKTLYIEKTKFKKDRLIPLPLPAAREIDNYLSVRKAFLGSDQNPYLLARDTKKRLQDYQIRNTFKKGVKDIGLYRVRQVIGHTVFSAPVVHSLRHSFAVNTLKRIKAKGASPQNALPVLAVYMGHVKYKHTTKYLKGLDTNQRKALADFTRTHPEDE